MRDCQLFNAEQLRNSDKLRHWFYKEKRDLLSIARRIKCGPYSVLLRIMGREAMNDPYGQVWSRAEQTAYNLATLRDEISQELPGILVAAKEYEADLHQHLQGPLGIIKGCLIETEQDLRNRGCTATPDFVFPKGVPLSSLLLGQQKTTTTMESKEEEVIISWVECKNTFGCFSKVQTRRLLKQITRYGTRWGRGVVVFALGFSVRVQESIQAKGHLCLHYRSLRSSSSDHSERVDQ